MKYILALLLIINTSFVDYEVKKKYWICVVALRTKNAQWIDPKIVEAQTLNEAKSKFNSYLKNQPCYADGTIGLYSVVEFIPESDILGFTGQRPANSPQPKNTRESYEPQGAICN
jgi:hypothetical protein